MSKHEYDQAGFRRCKTCGVLKPIDEYYSMGRGYFRHECKACYRAARSKTGKTYERRVVIDGKRQCPGCGLWLEENSDNFHRKARPETGFQTKCKTCRNRENSEYNRKRKAGTGG